MDKITLPYWAFLRGRIQQRATRRNEPVTCSGGEVTTTYLDLKGLFHNGSLMRPMATALWEYRIALGLPSVTAFGGPTMGADVISHAMACMHCIDWFSVRDEPRDHGMRRLIEGAELNAADRVILTDDVVSTGTSLRKAFDAVQATGAEIVAVMPLVDRAGVAQKKLGFIPYFPLFTHEELGLKAL